MEKLIKDGMVAVLYSANYGAGWSTWNTGEELNNVLLFHPLLVNMVEEGRRDEITEDIINSLLSVPQEYICILGSDGLKVEWLKEGERFDIHEYDGAETIYTIKDLTYTA